MNINQPKQLIEFNLIRAVSVVGIFIYHFCCHSNSIFHNFISCNNLVDWGSTFVTIFFLLSGMLLYYKNPGISSVKNFYKKRFIAIYPSYYVVCLFYLCMIFFPSFVESIKIQNPLVFLFSIIGLDGYLYSAGILTFHLISDWFLGAIIILYLIYPLLIYFINKYIYYSIAIICFCFFLTINFDMLHPTSFRNIFSCLFSFFLGIVIMKSGLYKNKIIQIISFFIFIIIFCFPIKMNYSLACHISGVSLFYILYFCAEFLMKNVYFSKSINFLSNISFEIYLIHHFMLINILSLFNPKNTILSFLTLIITFVLIFFIAFGVKTIVKFILNSTNKINRFSKTQC